MGEEARWRPGVAGVTEVPPPLGEAEAVPGAGWGGAGLPGSEGPAEQRLEGLNTRSSPAGKCWHRWGRGASGGLPGLEGLVEVAGLRSCAVADVAVFAQANPAERLCPPVPQPLGCLNFKGRRLRRAAAENLALQVESCFAPRFCLKSGGK